MAFHEVSLCLYDRAKMPVDAERFAEIVAKFAEHRTGLEFQMESSLTYVGLTVPGDTRVVEGRVMVTVLVPDTFLFLLNSGIRPADMRLIPCAVAEARLSPDSESPL